MMVRAVWARRENEKQLYLINTDCEFIHTVKRYLDYLATLEKSPHTLENYCRHLCYYFTFLEQAHLVWQQVTPDDLVRFVQWLCNPLRQVNAHPLHGVSPLSAHELRNEIVSSRGHFITRIPPKYELKREWRERIRSGRPACCAAKATMMGAV